MQRFRTSQPLLFRLARVVLCCCLACDLLAQEVPPPPDGILDETRALSEEVRRQIAAELTQFRADLKCDAWITASSFMPAGRSVRRHAQLIRQAWSGPNAAVLMAYDRGANSAGVSFSPALWQRYSSAELVEIMQDVGRTLADNKLTLEERLMLATRLWMERLRLLERARLQQSLLLQKDEKQLALVLAAGLGGLAVLGLLGGILSRRNDAYSGETFYFPEVQVSMRLGAPYGGGVAVELKTGVSLQ